MFAFFGKRFTTGLSRHQKILIATFVAQRDNYPDIVYIEDDCANCFLNASCFNVTDNVWFPRRCRKNQIQTLDNEERIAIVGDSRMRQLFAGLILAVSGNDAKVNESCKGEEIDIAKLKQPNSRVEGGLQCDFSHTSDYMQLQFLWEPHLKVTDLRLEMLISELKPTLLLFGGGLWYLAENKKLSEYEKAVEKFAAKISKKNIKSVFMHQTKPANFNHGLYDADDVNRLNDVSRKLLNEKFSSIVHFDSHLRLHEKYLSLCSQLNDFDDVKNGEWLCNNANHSGFVIVRHFAKLVLHWMINGKQ